MSSQGWATPQAYFDWLHKRFKFTVDACAEEWNAKLPTYWTPQDDGLKQSWVGHRVFCNPPYNDIAPWVHKAMKRHAELAVLLLPSRTDQAWFHYLWKHHGKAYCDGEVWIEFEPKRVAFVPPPGVKHSSPREANLLAIIRP